MPTVSPSGWFNCSLAHLDPVEGSPAISTTINPASSLIPLQPDEVELHVASLIVHARPEALSGAKRWLLQQPGVEIHAESERGKLVVVIESYQAQDILDLIDRAREQAGVLNVALIYHEF